EVKELREYAFRELQQRDLPEVEGVLVPARLALFENGWFAFLSADDGARYNVVQVHGKDMQIVRKRIAELSTDDPLVLRLGATGDYIEEAADKLMGENATLLRQMQKRWKARLSAQIREYSSIELAARELRTAGCTVASLQNIRRWEAPRSIGLASRNDW